MEIEAWLRSLGLERYKSAFHANDIDMDVLPCLTAEDLSNLGVESIGHRRKLLNGIASLVHNPAHEPVTVGQHAHPPLGHGSFDRPAPLRAEAERRQLTVVFCDLIGSTDLSTRLDPEDLRDIVSSYQDCCTGIIDSLGGHVAQYMGDGVLAYFGYPQAYGDDAERAVRAGLELARAVGRLQSHEGMPLRVRIGIATGIVIVGDLVGSCYTDERAVIGVTPNLAARLQTLAAPDTVVISEGTRKLVGGMFDIRDLGAHHLKGFANLVPVWQVIGERHATSRFEALRSSILAPLVGRDGEVTQLLDLWQRAKSGKGQVVLISGEPGIGKSRLVCALQDHLSGDPHTFRGYQCSPLRQNSQLFPVIRRLEFAAGFDRNDTSEEKYTKLEALLSKVNRHCEEFSMIADLLALPPGDLPPPSDISHHKRREKLLNTLMLHLVDLADYKPLVVLFEDVQWSDPTSLELLGLAFERIRHLRVLLIITFRPEFKLPWSDQPHMTSLPLDDLRPQDAAALVERIAAGKNLPGGVIDEIVARTDGIPLFVEEMTKAVVEADCPDTCAGYSTGMTATTRQPVPATLHTSLLARLDRLGRAKEIAQVGAVIGREFSYELLASVTRWTGKELWNALNLLTAAGLIFRRGDLPNASFVFKHALVQDAAYDTLLRAKRRRLHGFVAQNLASVLPDTIDAHPELLAHHYAQAGMTALAVSYWGKAGRQAIARSAMAEAAGHLRNALELLQALPETPARKQHELDLRLALGGALAAIKGHTAPETGEVFRRARALCEELGDTAKLLPIVAAQGMFHVIRAELDATLEVAGSLLRWSRQVNSPGGRHTAHRLTGISLLYMGRLPQARRHLDVAAGILSRAGTGAATLADGKRALVSTCVYQAMLLLFLGRYDKSREQIVLALEKARRVEDSHLLATALVLAGWCHLLMGEDAPRELIGALGELGEKIGLSYWTTDEPLHRGIALVRAGDVRKGTALVRQAVTRYDALGEVAQAATALCLTAGLTGGDEGRSLVNEVYVRLERTGIRILDAEVCRVRGTLLASDANCAAAEAEFIKAIHIARRQGAKHWEMRATVSLANLWRDQNRGQEIRSLLAQVYEGATENKTSDLKKASALFQQLESKTRVIVP
jgi:class 3 adenylate cyclase/tetratricopeptide (TPR) repeat protein